MARALAAWSPASRGRPSAAQDPEGRPPRPRTAWPPDVRTSALRTSPFRKRPASPRPYGRRRPHVCLSDGPPSMPAPVAASGPDASPLGPPDIGSADIARPKASRFAHPCGRRCPHVRPPRQPTSPMPAPAAAAGPDASPLGSPDIGPPDTARPKAPRFAPSLLSPSPVRVPQRQPTSQRPPPDARPDARVRCPAPCATAGEHDRTDPAPGRAAPE